MKRVRFINTVILLLIGAIGWVTTSAHVVLSCPIFSWMVHLFLLAANPVPSYPKWNQAKLFIRTPYLVFPLLNRYYEISLS